MTGRFFFGVLLLTAAGCSFDSSGPSDPSAGADGGSHSDGGGGTVPDAGEPDAFDPTADTDGDGLLDGEDNCPGIANVLQRDEDSDGRGDRCDNCPTIANPGQHNDLEVAAGAAPDTVGDACDPRPAGAGDSIALFDSFEGFELHPRWDVATGNPLAWGVDNGTLFNSSFGEGRQVLATHVTGGTLVVETSLRFLDLGAIDATGQVQAAGVVAAYENGPNFDFGLGCSMLASGGFTGAEDNTLELLGMGGAVTVLDQTALPFDITNNTTYRVSFGFDRPQLRQRCEVELVASGASATVESFGDSSEGQAIGVRSVGVDMAYDYVIVYRLGGPLN